ncbi:hypothetical protein [Lentzea albida]|uniref:Helix-turn-helix domain-containing protein n=1 Tax=Lentzea albida TaxID=65499 RepID=A0A1H9VHQ1_9PSEU|nr:hypothetical protein [Lentzea albida]SES21235.1 hypothetical protein SAMN04488000_118135 [Lentzea albida]
MSDFTIRQAPAPADKFRIVSNDFLRGRLPVPLKALERVLLGYFISLPDGWRMNRRQLDESVVEGRDAVTKALAGLEAKGYLSRSKVRGRHGAWSWSWSVTADPIAQPLKRDRSRDGQRDNGRDAAPPSPESQSMDATSGNSASPQVAPSTETPSTESQSIKEEDGGEKTDLKTGFQGGTPVGAHADAQADPRTPIHGQHLVGLDPKALTQKLTAIWCAVVREHNGSLPIQDGGGWDVDGTPLERGRHPIGGSIKAWCEQWRNPTVEALDAVLTQIRGDARLWAERHPERGREAAA